MPSEWQRTSGTLSAFVAHYLLTGEPAPGRVHGWVSFYQIPTSEFDTVLRSLWKEHEAFLVAEAHRAGFEPFYVTRTRPRGPAVMRWSDGFCEQHQY